MKIIKLICEHCKKEFEKTDYFVRGELNKKSDHKFYCSKKCVYEHRTVLKQVITPCNFCKKDIKMDENNFKRSKEHFCNIQCRRTYQKIPINQRREKVDLICSQCQTPFIILKRVYNKRLKIGNKNFYCSSKCAQKARRNDYSKTFIIKCDECSKEITKTGRQLKLTKFHFCTPSCKGSYFARIYTLGEKRSRLEKAIENHIKKVYPDITFIVNDRQVLRGLELDFWFPTLDLAIEVNGPAHFTPIYGDESLIKTQKHDIIKKNICQKKRIRLLEITDTLSYTEDNSLEIFEKYVKPIIEGLKNI